MCYLIPRGTPLEIAQYGHSFCEHITKCDLAFSEPLSATRDELMFHDGYWQIIVSRAMVFQEDGASSADESKTNALPLTPLPR